jgi:hypothetical protein
VADSNSTDNVLSGSCDRVEFHGDQVLVSFGKVGAVVPARVRPVKGRQVVFHVDERSSMCTTQLPGSACSKDRAEVLKNARYNAFETLVARVVSLPHTRGDHVITASIGCEMFANAGLRGCAFVLSL